MILLTGNLSACIRAKLSSARWFLSKGHIMQLSKSDYLMFRDEPIHLWATKHGQDTTRTESASDVFTTSQGMEVESYAESYMRDVVLPGYASAELELQPTYEDGAFMSRADAVIFDREAEVYDIYEIKGSTRLKTEHEYDATFQRLVCEASIPVRRMFVVYLNEAYQLQDVLDISALFLHEDVTAITDELYDTVKTERDEALTTIQRESPQTLTPCKNPDTCPCLPLCHPTLPAYPIYDLPRLSQSKVDALRDQGIYSIVDIPDDFALSATQKPYADAVRAGQPHIDRQAIQQFLDALEFPLCFLDYETYPAAIPRFPGHEPYQHMVFQYSLHILDSPQSELRHIEFLSHGDEEPGRAVAAHLVEHMPDSGSVIVWFARFEVSRTEEMAALYPEYAEKLKNINQRVVDLMEPFQDGLYVHPDFKGSTSIKNVLPVLAPDFSYDGMAISNGVEALLAWGRLADGKVAAADREQVIQDMLRYCELDTLAMVKIWEHLSGHRIPERDEKPSETLLQRFISFLRNLFFPFRRSGVN
jgi:hypothetical protein